MNSNYPGTGWETAVIGMAGRFPGAENIRQFWDNLKNGVESIAFFSREELEKSMTPSELWESPQFVKAMASIDDIEHFDASFFDYRPKEAEMMDPQARIFHECTWEAFEDAAYDPSAYKGSIGFFAGAFPHLYWKVLAARSGRAMDIDPYSASKLMEKDFMNAYISYKFNLNGPSYSVFTACSTSLVAIHLASQSILNGECDMALAGGVMITIAGYKAGYLYKEGMITSPDGHCRAFDAKAKGTVGGMGAGVVLLKRLEDAVNDGDHIYALIKGSAINNDGERKIGFTAPSVQGQVEVLRTAMQMAEVEPGSIGYLEAHGTGTPLGDPVEIEALKLAFNTDKKGFCPIGSVKTNIGHLDTAAGVAGFIKVVLALKYRMIPPSLHFETSNPKIDFGNSPFYVNTQLKEWKPRQFPLRAGVSSFGIGGTNAHVVLEEWPGAHSKGRRAQSTVNQGRSGVPSTENAREYHLILLSAKTQSALDKMAGNLVEYIKRDPDINLADAAYTLQVGRKAFPYRGMVVSPSVDEAVRALSHPETGELKTFRSPRQNPPVVFMFPGQGSQYVDMGRELYEKEPGFRKQMNGCFDILNSLRDADIKEILYPGERKSQGAKRSAIDQTDIAQPVIFILEYALAKLLIALGITPHRMIGHSVGEYTAACLSGVLSLEDAIKLVVLRGKLMKKMSPGAMLSVKLPGEQTRKLCGDFREVELAAVNGPHFCVVSGPPEAIDAFAASLGEKGCQYQRLHTSHAFHSRSMEPILEEFQEAVGTVKRNPPVIPYISNLTGKPITPGQVADPGCWARQIRHPVQFGDGLAELCKEPDTVFIEVGPGRNLSTFVQDHPGKNPGHQTVNLLRHPQENVSDTFYFLSKIGLLWLYGKSIDWKALHQGRKYQRLTLPTYPFERQRYWELLASNSSRKNPFDQSPGKPRPIQGISDWFYTPSWKQKPLSPHLPDREATGKKRVWLVFIDQSGIGTRLVKQLEEQGHEVIGIKRGSTFARQEDHGYVINPQESDHYQRLCREIGQRREKPDRFVYLWSITGRTDNEPKEAPGNLATVDFYQLLWLVQAMDHEKFDQSLQLTVVSDGMQEVTGQEEQQPHKAVLLGPVKVVPQEYSQIRCRSIDILLPEPNTPDEAKLLDLLTAELITPIEETVIAFRNRIRWVQDYEPLKLEEEIKERRSKLKQGGVWLITGGLGGIGLALARHLAAALQARLVLTGRGEFPHQDQWQEWLNSHGSEDRTSQKIQQLQEIKTLGAELLVCTADAVDQGQMQQVIKQAETQFGPLNAVVHAAGELNKDTFLLVPQLGKTECERQFRPKIAGLAVLEKVLEGRDLDLCILTSSLSSVLGGLGYTAYAAANLFMDAFTRKHNRTSPQQWLSVNLDAWQTHRSPVPEPPISDHSQAEQKIMTAEQGVETLMRVMTWGEGSQVVVSASPLQIKIDRWIKLQFPHEEKGKSPGEGNREQPNNRRERPQLTTPLVAPRNSIERSLAVLWQDFFGLDRVGINDNFFELGGDSLKAMTITSTIQGTFNTTLPVMEIFNNPTIAGLAGSLRNAKENRFQGIPPVETREYYPLTPAQKRLFILQQMDPESIGYNVQLNSWWPGEPQKEKIQEAFQQLFQRHEILRTSFGMMESQPVQKVHAPDDIELAIRYHDIGNINPGAGDNQEGLAGILNGFVRPFDLSNAPLLRVGIARKNMQSHLLFIDIHHITADLISQNLLMKELRMILQGETPQPLKIQYKDFTLWQSRPERKAEILQQEAYWLKKFSGELPVLNVPADYPRPRQQGFEGSFIRFTIGEEETRQLRALAASAEATLFIVLLSIYTVLLSKLSGQEDIIVGTALAGRDHADLEKILGMFVKTLALRNFLSGEKRFEEYLQETKEQFHQARENQDYPFEDLVEKLKIRKGTNRNPLFDVLFTLQKLNRKDTAGTGEGISETFDYGTRSIQFDMILTVMERERYLEIEAEFYSKLFKKETRERYTRYFKELISTVQKDPGVRLKDLSITRQFAAARIEIPTVDFKF